MRRAGRDNEVYHIELVHLVTGSGEKSVATGIPPLLVRVLVEKDIVILCASNLCLIAF
jgi:hypothetical protein